MNNHNCWVMLSPYKSARGFCFLCWDAEVETISCNRTELTPTRPFFFWIGATLHCLWRRFKRERWGESLSYPVCVRADPQRLVFIHPHMTKTEQKERTETVQGKEKVFIFLYMCKGRICGTRVKERRLPPALCLELALVRAAAITCRLSEPDSKPTLNGFSTLKRDWIKWNGKCHKMGKRETTPRKIKYNTYRRDDCVFFIFNL